MSQFHRRQIVLEETAGVERVRWPIVIRLAQIAKDIAAVNWTSLRLTDSAGQPLAVQVDRLSGHDGYDADDEIAFQVDLQPNEQRDVYVVYDEPASETLTTIESDLAVRHDNGRVIVENSRFLWELTDGEPAEVRIKTADGPSESWTARTYTQAGGGSATAPWDEHFQGRRRLVRVADCQVVAVGPVRAVIDLHYDDVHFESNNDVRRRLIVYSDSPLIEKVSTSVLGENTILLATLVGKLGELTLAEGTVCGLGRSLAITYPRSVAARPDRPRDHELGFYKSPWPAPRDLLGRIDGVTWGAVWNSDSKLGKGEIACADDVADFVFSWEQGAFHPGGSPAYHAAHPATDRVLADFEFLCTANRTFRHYAVMLDLSADGDAGALMDRLTKAIANPISVTVDVEELCDDTSALIVAPSQIICDLSAGAHEFDVALPPDKAPDSMALSATGELDGLLELPDLTGPLVPGERCLINVHDPDAVPAGVHTGTVELTVNNQRTLSVPVTLLKADRPPHGEIRYGPVLPTALDAIRIDVRAHADTWLTHVALDWWCDGQRFTQTHTVPPHQSEAEASFEIPPQRPGEDVRYTITVGDVHGKTAGLHQTLTIVDAVLDCPPQVYADDDLTVAAELTNTWAGPMTAHIRLVIDEQEIASETVTIEPGQTGRVTGRRPAGAAGKRDVHALIELDGRLAVLMRAVTVVDRPDLPHEDFVSLLARPDKRTLHGNLVRYWGGQMCPEYALTEPETLGLTHPWFYDGTCYGSDADHNWEFWRNEAVAHGIIRDRDTGELAIYPPVDRVDWQPGRMDCHYAIDGLAIRETKFINSADAVGDVIRLENTTDQTRRLTLLFKGKGRGMSEAGYDPQRRAVVIDEHAYAYTGLKKILTASQPMDCWALETDEAAIDARIRSGEIGQSGQTGEMLYGNPVWYVFGFDIELAPGESTELVLALAFDRDLDEGCHKLYDLIASPQRHLEAVRFQWNYWFNYDVPRFDCSDPAWRELYYYLYFCYRANLLDVGEGFHAAPCVAPTAITNVHTQSGWDCAFGVWIGQWLADPQVYTYGNLTNWALVQEPCGFLPEYFGKASHATWAGGSMSLLAESLYDLHKHTGDADLVKQSFETFAGFEAWQACEIDFSPYWTFYHNNVPDWRDRKALAEKGEPWTAETLDYYRRLASLAEVAGDEDRRDHFDRKATLCERRLREAYDADPTGGIAPGIAADRMPTNHGMHLYENHTLVPPEPIERFLDVLTDPRQMWTTLPMPQQSLAHPRPGDIRDVGTSVTVDYFITEGLFRAGIDAPAMEIVTRLIEASFMDADGRRVPIAPEYWDQRAEPWGSIEYAWNGLINNFLLARICGLLPDVPSDTLTIQPHVPEHLDSVSAVIPLAGGWTHVAHRIDRDHKTTITTAVKDAALKTVELRYKIPSGCKLSSAKLDGKKLDVTPDGAFVVMTVEGKKTFNVEVRFEKA